MGSRNTGKALRERTRGREGAGLKKDEGAGLKKEEREGESKRARAIERKRKSLTRRKTETLHSPAVSGQGCFAPTGTIRH